MSVNSNKNSKQVSHYAFGTGTSSNIEQYIGDRVGYRIFLLDRYFQDKGLKDTLPIKKDDILRFVDVTHEPKTTAIDKLINDIKKEKNGTLPGVIIGIGGGSTLDTAKAIANLFTNPGKAEDYQGWDLVKYPGIFKIGVPTISGTGAESS